MRWASGDGVSPSAAKRGVEWRGVDRCGAARLGWVRLGAAWQGKGCDGSTEGLRVFPAAFIGGQGWAGSGAQW
jgi:hypothetical protein